MRPCLKKGDGAGCGGTPVTPALGQWRQADSWCLLASMPSPLCKPQANANKQKTKMGSTWQEQQLRLSSSRHINMCAQKASLPSFCIYLLCYLKLEVRFLPSSTSKHVNYLRSVSLKLVIQTWLILKWPSLSSPLKSEDTKMRVTKLFSNNETCRQITQWWNWSFPSNERKYFMERAETVIFHSKNTQNQT